ncbi:head fiber protein [Rhodococcus erythropolis]|uniref:head fiber protein n=1 Tax=Rhodococcus erythropolis TaxID=1833 RepID=UPI0030135051
MVDTDVNPVPAATTTVVGGVKKGAAVAPITPATDGTAAGTALNALIASLKAAGVIA